MSDMQRFGYCSTCVCPLPKADGRWVLLADAEAAIAAAFQGGMGQMIGGIEQVSYDKGQRYMLARCLAAVEAEHPRGVRWWADWLFGSRFRRRLVTYGYDWHKRHAVEALRALEEKP